MIKSEYADIELLDLLRKEFLSTINKETGTKIIKNLNEEVPSYKDANIENHKKHQDYLLPVYLDDYVKTLIVKECRYVLAYLAGKRYNAIRIYRDLRMGDEFYVIAENDIEYRGVFCYYESDIIPYCTLRQYSMLRNPFSSFETLPAQPLTKLADELRIDYTLYSFKTFLNKVKRI